MDGVQVQRLTIRYNCVGTIDIPNLLPLHEPELSHENEKGRSRMLRPSDKSRIK